MKELEEMKKSFDEFMAKAEQTLVRMKGTAPKEILDKEEKEYLETVIRPFKDRVEYIIKYHHSTRNVEWLYIDLSEAEEISLPYFKENTMYKGMELDKGYTLEELGLFEGE